MQPARPWHGDQLIYLTALAVFLGSAWLTWRTLHDMGGSMPMPGGWTMSMMWMSMPGQSRLDMLVMFVGMWAAMMVAMMLPSTLPTLVIYGRVLRFRNEARRWLLVSTMAAAYFVVWSAFGVIALVIGSAVAEVTMRSASLSLGVPIAAGLALMLGGVYQLTAWKSACLQHCRDPVSLIAAHLDRGWRGASRLGLHHGTLCVGCCWGLMLIQLVLGVMSLAAMVAVACVIAAEKLLARGPLIARGVGVAAILLGAAQILRAVG